MLPNFLVIGAQKSGTTWLDRNLRKHPGIWLPPEKEIHFFDFPRLMPFYFLLFSFRKPVRHWAKSRILRDYAKVKAGQQTWKWYLRYYFSWRSRAWYASLFTPEATQHVTGELTPRYAILKHQRIREIHTLMPDCKIVYLLRNPVERMWSDLAMYQGSKFGGGGMENLSQNEMLAFLTNSQHLANSNYLGNLHRWSGVFPREQIFIGFYEQICNDPRQLLDDIFCFLGVDTSDHILDSIDTRKINAQSYPVLPVQVENVLSKLLIEEMIGLYQYLPNEYTASWLKRAQSHLAG